VIRKIILASLVLVACSQEKATSELAVGGSRVGYFKGVEALTTQMRATMVSPEDRHFFDFRIFVDGDDSFDSGLSDMLGSVKTINGQSKMQNNIPNGINMLLYDLSLAKLGEAIAANCLRNGNYEIETPYYSPVMHTHYAEAVIAACKYSGDTNHLESLWFGTMGWGAPEAELTSWKEFVEKNKNYFMSLSPEKRVAELLQSIFLNPYYLLER
jgi:hypothetical protein